MSVYAGRLDLVLNPIAVVTMVVLFIILLLQYFKNQIYHFIGLI